MSQKALPYYKSRTYEYQRIWRRINSDKANGYYTNYRKTHPEQRTKSLRKYYDRNKEKISKYGSQWKRENRVRVNLKRRLWRRNNPETSDHFSYELREAMDNARTRNKNTCQWYGCGLTFRQTTIQAHHIFPKKEYPDLQLVEQYIICYCMEHHTQWHEARGDAVGFAMRGFIEKSLHRVRRTINYFLE